MHYHQTRHMTIAEYMQEQKSLLKFEKEYEHERRVVCSIPEKEIGTQIHPTDNNERWVPG